MPPTIDAIELRAYRRPLDPPFHASWDPTPRRAHATTVVRVRAGGLEGVGAGDARTTRQPYLPHRSPQMLHVRLSHVLKSGPLDELGNADESRPHVVG